MLYTLKEIVTPGARTAYQIRDPNDALVVELFDYPTIERTLKKLNQCAHRRHTQALGHISSCSAESHDADRSSSG